jgi:spore coat polysaccharide biosynthesis predicted glycosyltransferase SpsG
MPASLDDFRNRLIRDILDAATLAEVNNAVCDALKELERNAVNGHIVVRFADKLLSELEQFKPVKNKPKQWSNINIARALVNRIKAEMKIPAH